MSKERTGEVLPFLFQERKIIENAKTSNERNEEGVKVSSSQLNSEQPIFNFFRKIIQNELSRR